jgi:chromosome segregation ATPase
METAEAVRIVRELVDGPEPLRSPWDEALEAVLAALEETRDKYSDREAVAWRDRADKAERERDELRAEVERLTYIVNDRQERGNEMLGRAEKAEAEMRLMAADVRESEAALAAEREQTAATAWAAGLVASRRLPQAEAKP